MPHFWPSILHAILKMRLALQNCTRGRLVHVCRYLMQVLLTYTVKPENTVVESQVLRILVQRSKQSRLESCLQIWIWTTACNQRRCVVASLISTVTSEFIHVHNHWPTYGTCIWDCGIPLQTLADYNEVMCLYTVPICISLEMHI